MSRRILCAALLLTGSVASFAAAQTAPAPATPAQTAPAKTAPKAGAGASSATSRTVTAATLLINKTLKGQFVGCPAALRVSPQAICLYSKSAAAPVRSAVTGGLGNAALGEWKMTGQDSTLLVREATAANTIGAFVWVKPLGAAETLVIVDVVSAKAAATAATPKVSAPAGVVKGEAYLLGSDLAGVVNVVDLGAGKYRLNVAGQTAITVTAGNKAAQRAGGRIDLPTAPVTDGKNLIFPVSGLRALGCTVSDAKNGLTIACGSDSVGVKPIVF